jgi:hypothetical protein
METRASRKKYFIIDASGLTTTIPFLPVLGT